MTLPDWAKAFALSTNAKLAYAVALGAAAADQLSKALVINALHLPERFSIPVLPPLLRFTMVWNRGVTFGLFKADTAIGRTMISLLALVVVGVLGRWAYSAERRLTAISLGLIMGGAIGNNLIDRIRLGHVADFIDVTGIGFFPWVFNVADILIDVGVALLAYDLIRSEPPKAG